MIELTTQTSRRRASSGGVIALGRRDRHRVGHSDGHAHDRAKLVTIADEAGLVQPRGEPVAVAAAPALPPTRPLAAA